MGVVDGVDLTIQQTSGGPECCLILSGEMTWKLHPSNGFIKVLVGAGAHIIRAGPISHLGPAHTECVAAGY